MSRIDDLDQASGRAGPGQFQPVHGNRSAALPQEAAKSGNLPVAGGSLHGQQMASGRQERLGHGVIDNDNRRHVVISLPTEVGDRKIEVLGRGRASRGLLGSIAAVLLFGAKNLSRKHDRDVLAPEQV